MKQYLSAEDIAEVLRGEGDAAISGRTVHYYAEQRLLPPPEYHGARPRYTEAHLAAVRRIRELKRQGHSLETIGALLGVPTSAPRSEALREPQVPAAPAAAAPSVQLAGQRSTSTARTLVVGPGLTLSASGWDDASLRVIVRAITDAIQTMGRADARERGDDGITR